MEPWDPAMGSAQAARHSRAYVQSVPSERSCWVALPAAMCNRLYESTAAMPVFLRLTCIDDMGENAESLPVSPRRHAPGHG